ncbi:hypothetical protein L580_4474 [Serratia fonticola AU-P3(3)]|nr:hypothetical protein L581_3449 [Serratia fonticola AU-AP2C]ERK12201.1 hypothetical protein L580_4474 [Serratia fonticola AU-P3(3)]
MMRHLNAVLPLHGLCTAFGTCRPRLGMNNRHIVVIDEH